VRYTRLSFNRYHSSTMRNLCFVFFGIICSFGSIFAQEINQMDADGQRHGVWKKYFPASEQLRYEGEFDHGIEIGTFTFYCAECGTQPMIVKKFSGKTGNADVMYFTAKGKLVSQGRMEGKKRVGEWLYYHEKSEAILTREQYTNGLLNGITQTFYANGKLTEEVTYIKGLKEGPNKYYSPDGILLKKLLYLNDQLHGAAEYYDAHGNVTIQGQYLKGKKHGLWKYFKNGKLELEEIYPKPRKNGNQ